MTRTKSLTHTAAGWLHAFIHFTVDAACFYFLFSRLSAHLLWGVLALFYDALAFPTQSLFGLLTDRFPRFNAGITGCCMITAAFAAVGPAGSGADRAGQCAGPY